MISLMFGVLFGALSVSLTVPAYASPAVKTCPQIFGQTTELPAEKVDRKRTGLNEMSRWQDLSADQVVRENFENYEEQTAGRWNSLKPGTASLDTPLAIATKANINGIPSQPRDREFEKAYYPDSLQVYVVRTGPLERTLPNQSSEESIRTGLAKFFRNYHGKDQFIVDDQRNLLIDSTPEKSDTRNLFDVDAVVRTLYGDLYGAYGNQGPERRNNLSQYSDQDRDGAERTLHTMVIFQGIPLAHIQAKVSRGPSESHNFEHNFTKIDRPNVVSVELGRLFMALNEKFGFITDGYLRNKDFREYTRHLLYSRIFHWINWDARPDVVYAQVNDEKLEKFLAPESPLHFHVEKPLFGPQGKEWLIAMNRDEMLSSEAFQMNQLLRAQLNRFMSPDTGEPMRSEMTLKFERNQYDVLKRIGVIKTDSRSQAISKEENYHLVAVSDNGTAAVSEEALSSKPFLLLKLSQAAANSMLSERKTQISAMIETRSKKASR